MSGKSQHRLVLLFLSVTLLIVVLMSWLITISNQQTFAAALTPFRSDASVTIEQQVSPNPVLNGKTAVYTLQVTNTSTLTLPLLITDTLPSHVAPTGILTWTPTIQAGAVWTERLTVTVAANPQDELVNQVQVKMPTSRADNRSYCTTCAEEDNINIPLYGPDISQFRIVATHPIYPFTTDNCAADFSGCGLTTFAPQAVTCQPLWDDGLNVITVCNDSDWWRPQTMTVMVGSDSLTGHRLVWNRKIADEASWPEVLVWYQDGNLRLKPHPQPGRADVCFGSSVIVGPAVPDDLRPFVELESIVVDPEAMSLDATYLDGGTAHLELAVDRTQAQVEVMAAYETAVSLATFRSMYVADDNADVARVETAVGDYALLDLSASDWSVAWSALSGPRWFFYREAASNHNTSAPDILIEALDGTMTHTSKLTAYVEQYYSYLPVVVR